MVECIHTIALATFSAPVLHTSDENTPQFSKEIGYLGNSWSGSRSCDPWRPSAVSTVRTS